MFLLNVWSLNNNYVHSTKNPRICWWWGSNKAGWVRELIRRVSNVRRNSTWGKGKAWWSHSDQGIWWRWYHMVICGTKKTRGCGQGREREMGARWMPKEMQHNITPAPGWDPLYVLQELFVALLLLKFIRPECFTKFRVIHFFNTDFFDFSFS